MIKIAYATKVLPIKEGYFLLILTLYETALLKNDKKLLGVDYYDFILPVSIWNKWR